jgi:hypothetical protein
MHVQIPRPNFLDARRSSQFCCFPWLFAERISQPRMLQILAELGARDRFLLDGEGSSAMGVGGGSTGIPATVLLGGGCPVAANYSRASASPIGQVSWGLSTVIFTATRLSLLFMAFDDRDTQFIYFQF